jgi:KUP system potassium uptake protein
MATLRIADTVHPARSSANATSNDGFEGVYPARINSRTSFDRRSAKGRRGSFARRSVNQSDTGGVEDEESGLRQAGDFKKKQVQRNLQNGA